jgi:hypothetical protein
VSQPEAVVPSAPVEPTGKVRQFASGATRDTDQNKLNYRGFENPFVTKRFAEFMHKNRRQSNGELRAADNWQKGIPREAYMESLERHVNEVKEMHEAEAGRSPESWGVPVLADRELLLDTLSAVIFNAQGMMLEIMKGTKI